MALHLPIRRGWVAVSNLRLAVAPHWTRHQCQLARATKVEGHAFDSQGHERLDASHQEALAQWGGGRDVSATFRNRTSNYRAALDAGSALCCTSGATARA